VCCGFTLKERKKVQQTHKLVCTEYYLWGGSKLDDNEE